MKAVRTILMLALCVSSLYSRGQGETTKDSATVVVDGLQFEAHSFGIDSADRTATVELLLTNLRDQPRELTLNVYGTQLIDNERNAYYFSDLRLDRVLMRFTDKQNYLHYLLKPGTPVKLIINAADIASEASAIQLVRVVFEDSAEKGRFLDAYVSERP